MAYTQDELNELSRSMAKLNEDDLMIVVSNALMMHADHKPPHFVKRMSQIMINLTAVMESDTLSAQCVNVLRSMSDVFEATYINKRKVMIQ